MKNKKATVFFLVITFILSSICYYMIIRSKDAASGMVAVLMWCPAIAAFITQKKYYKNEKILGINKCNYIYNLLGFAIPIVYLLISYAIYWIIDMNSFSNNLGMSVFVLPLVFLSSIVTSLGEEIGWRGFLLPKLSEIYNVKKAIIISGLIWAIWHFPLIFAGLYKPGTPLWYQLSMFTLEVLLITIILTALRFKSKSVWPAVIFHASHNFFDQVIFMPLTISEKSAYYVGETGFITAIAMIAVAFFVVKKYKYIFKKDLHKQL